MSSNNSDSGNNSNNKDDLTREANRKLEDLWKQSINKRIRVLEEELEKAAEQIDALRRSLADLIEP